MSLGFRLVLILVPPKPGERRPPPLKVAPQLPSLDTEADFSSSFP